MSYRVYWFVVIFLFVFNLASGQNTNTELKVFNKYQFQEEVYSFPKPVRSGVGPGGALNLSIPVLSVPGRGGLNFDISFSYQSGIKVDQEASWIGLGWDFNPGSITRDIRGNLKELSCDYADAVHDMPDQYYATIPGVGSIQMFRGVHKIEGSTTRPPQLSQSQFQMKEYKPYKIEFQTISQILNGNFNLSSDQMSRYRYLANKLAKDSFAKDNDIGRFVITTDDGTHYIYEYPSIAAYSDISVLADPNRSIAYVSAWRLSAILSAEIPVNTELTPDNLEKYPGSWILFKYDYYPDNTSDQMEYYYLR